MIDETGDNSEMTYAPNEISLKLLEFTFVISFDDEFDHVFFYQNEKLILAGGVKQAMINARRSQSSTTTQEFTDKYSGCGTSILTNRTK